MNILQTEEAWTEDKTIQQLEIIFGHSNIVRQHDTKKISIKLKDALSVCKKNGFGDRPEAIILNNNVPYLLFEAKGKNGSIDLAVKEAKDYAEGIYKGGIRIPFILAVKENEIRLFYQKNNGEILICLNQNGNEIDFIPTKVEFQNLDKNEGRIVIETDEELSPEELQNFCNEINSSFHSNSIVESERAKLFTALLIALMNKTFVRQYLDNEGRLSIQEQYSNNKSKIYSRVATDLIKIIEDTEADKSITFSEKIKIIIEDDARAIWKITGDLLTKSDSKSFLTKLLNSAYLLGDIYETFYTYSGKNSMGQYFTPRHVVEFMVNITEQIRKREINFREDIVYDPACGVGGFLISAFKKGIHNARIEESKLAAEVMGLNGLFGVECASDVASIAKVNMLLRGDGKTGIIHANSLTHDIENHLDAMLKERRHKDSNNEYFIDRLIRPTLVLMNPPFPDKKEDPKAYEFILNSIKLASNGAYITALIPTSCILSKGNNKAGKLNESKFRIQALSNCQLKAVITLPQDLFYPKASINTSVVILQKTGLAHDTTIDTIFGRCSNDGFKPNKSTGIRTLQINKKFDNDLYYFEKVWLKDYLNGGALNIPLKFNVSKLTKEEVIAGHEWTPEARIIGRTICDDVVSNHKNIYSQFISLSINKDIYEGNVDYTKYENKVYKLDNQGIEKFKDTLIKRCGKSELTISDLFTHTNGNYKDDLALLENTGKVAIVSASEFNNGVLGYDDLPNNTKTFSGGISLAKNGKPCICRVQMNPCLLTGDVLFLKPNIYLNEKNLLILASIIEQKKWRYNYGRKATWDRIKNIKLFE